MPLTPYDTKRRSHLKLNAKYHNVISTHLKFNVGVYAEHSIQWENVKILHQENSFYKRTFDEMVFIKKEGSNNLKTITDSENLIGAYNIILDYL